MWEMDGDQRGLVSSRADRDRLRAGLAECVTGPPGGWWLSLQET